MDHSMKKLLNQEATAGCERWVQLEFFLLLIQAVSQQPLVFLRYASSCSDIALYEELERSSKNSWNFVLLGQCLLKSPATTNLFRRATTNLRRLGLSWRMLNTIETVGLMALKRQNFLSCSVRD
ncbi:hypothetical protein ACFX2B_045744 [Malus domestica]